MTDVHSAEIRSFNMSRIKSKNTKPEMLVRKFLFSKGFRYRLHSTKLPGKPDLVFTKYKTVIFVNGCFWHGHEGCKYFVVPKTKTEWWINKISKTRKLDKENKEELEKSGWKVMTIFECQLKKDNRQDTLNELINKIK